MSKTTSTPKKETGSKAAVKADERLEIFKRLKLILSRYSPPLTAISDYESRYELVSKKQVTYRGKAVDQVYFGAVIIQSAYVGLYLSAVYDEPANLERIGEELRKKLKGKSCFHIKKLDDSLALQIEQAVKTGFEYYEKEGMI
jgi:hypothetical protein